MNAQVRMSDSDANLLARNAVLNSSINMWQEIAAGTVPLASARGAVLNIPIRNVGLLKRLVIEISTTIVQAAAETLTLTKLGPANFLSSVVLTDLNNQTRVNTAGWHLHLLASARRQAVFGAAFTNDSPVSMGNNFNTITATASVTSSAKTVRTFYEVPISYGDYDLRGAIFANVVNATMNLQFTINSNFVIASGADATLGVYSSSSADLGTLTDVSYKVYQNYLDQLPMGRNGPIVPLMDLSTAYTLNNTTATGLVSGADFPLPYANFRNFMSTIVCYDNGGTLNVGSDVNYWAIQSANYTNILKYDPLMSSLLTRQILGDDMPPGFYYFDHRQKPISTINYGNMQLVMNPAGTVNSGAQLLVGYEALALINQLTGAGSLYSN